MFRIVFLCFMLFLGGCMFSKKDGSVIARPFSSVDASNEIILAPNHIFEIVLPSNPTTGYTWSLHIDNTKVVKKINQQFESDSSGRVGVGGRTTWQLETANTGTTSLTFAYGRAWEKDTLPTRVVTFNISVH